MAVVPAKFDGIVSHRFDSGQPGVRHVNKTAPRPMPLTQRAWTITAQVNLGIVSNVAIVPSDPHHGVSLDVIDFNGIVRFHE